MNSMMKTLHIDDTPYETEIPEGYFGTPTDGKRNRNEIRAIIPGIIADIKVKKGDRVSPGQVIIILEAMKMFNDVEVETEGRIAEININVGDKVEKDQVMVKIEP